MSDTQRNQPSQNGIDWYVLLVFTTLLAFTLANAMAWSGVLPIPMEAIVALAILSIVVMIPIFRGNR
jgi:hypothetical protein